MTIVCFVLDVSPSMGEAFALHEFHQNWSVPQEKSSAGKSEGQSALFVDEQADEISEAESVIANDPSPPSAAQNNANTMSQPFTRPYSYYSPQSSFTIMDAAKHAIDYFIRLLQRRKDVRSSLKCALFTTGFEGDSGASSMLKASLNDPPSHLLNQLKFIRCNKATDKPADMGLTLCQVFQYLHTYRMVNQIDCIGAGFYPLVHEPTFIIQLTCGGPLFETAQNSGSAAPFLASQLNIRGLQGSGCSYFREPFRWDQRLFTIFLKPAKAAQEWLDHCLRTKPTEQFLNGIGTGYCPSSQESQLASITAAAAAFNGDGKIISTDLHLHQIEYWMYRMAEVTLGDTVYCTSLPAMHRCIEALMSLPDSSRLQWTPPPIGLRPLLQPGVGVRFSFVTDEQPVDTPNPVFVDPALTVVFTEATGDGPTFAKIDRAELSWMKMAGYWPIPENYCPSEQMDKFPARLFSNPEIRVQMTTQKQDYTSRIPEGMMFKKYPIDIRSWAAQRLLQQPRGCWMCYVLGSGDQRYGPPEGYPFGFLKASTTGDAVNLWILPYNFPVLFKLLQSLRSFKGHNQLSEEWRGNFEAYLRTVPSYYHVTLRKCLAVTKLAVPIAYPSAFLQPFCPQAWNNYRQSSKTAAVELDKQSALARIPTNSYTSPKPAKWSLQMNAFDIPVDQLAQLLQQRMKMLFPSYVSPILTCQYIRDREDWKLDGTNPGFARMSSVNQFGPRDYRAVELDESHRLPVSVMSDYRSVMERQTPRLRFVSEEDEMRDKLLAFGNPYKRLTVRWKADGMSAVEDAATSSSGSSSIVSTTATVQLDDGQQSELEQEAIVTALNSADENRGLPLEFDPSSIHTTILLKRAHPRRRIRPHDPSKLHPRVLEALKELNVYVPPPATTTVPPPTNVEDESLMKVDLMGSKIGAPESPSSDSGYDSTANTSVDGDLVDKSRKRQSSASSEPAVRTSTSADVKRLKIMPAASVDSDTLKSLSSLIKRPGKSSSKILLDRLRDMPATADAKCRAIKELIAEAKRFKKQSLVEELNALSASLSGM